MQLALDEIGVALSEAVLPPLQDLAVGLARIVEQSKDTDSQDDDA